MGAPAAGAGLAGNGEAAELLAEEVTGGGLVEFMRTAACE
jgi:hypothetical protein